MNARNCARCGRIYSHLTDPPLCPKCKGQDEEDFKRVKKYLEDNPEETITNISMELDISLSKLKRFLREGRLEIIQDDNFILECERCKKPIKTGRYCEPCSREIASEMKNLTNKAANKKENTESTGFKRNEKMRYLNRDLFK